MSRILTALSLLICTTVHGQIFTDSYLLSNLNKVHESEKNYNITSANIFLTAKQREALTQKIVIQLQSALLNLNDPKLKLAPFYDNLWGVGFTEKLKRNIAELLKAIKDTSYNPLTGLNYVPDPNQLRMALFKTTIQDLDTSKVAPDEKKINLQIADPYKKWLVAYYKQSMSAHGMAGIEMDMDYILKWRQLENNYELATQSALALQKLAGRVMDCNDTNNPLSVELQAIIDFERKFPEANKLAIHSFLAGNEFIKNWLWYSNGRLSINPLVVTDPWRVYPISEPNRFLQTADSELFKSMDVDTALKRFFITKRVVNKVTMPMTTDGNKYLFYQYDANNKYNTDRKFNKKAINDKTNIAILVHNLPKNASIAIANSDADLKDRSLVSGQLDDALNLFSGALTDVGAKSSSISLLLNLLNPAQLGAKAHDAIVSVPSNNKVAGMEALGLISLQLAEIQDSSAKESFKEVLKGGAEVEVEVDFVLVNGNKIALIKNQDADKRSLLNASLSLPHNTGCKGKCVGIPTLVIDSFLSRDNCIPLNYEQSKIKVSVDRLQERFDCFLAKVKSCNDVIGKLGERLKYKMEGYLPYLQITNRSLPPVTTTEQTDESEIYHTAVFYPELPDAPKTRTYTLSEITKTGDKETTITVVKQTVKVASLHYFDISAGIAFTTSGYTIGQKGSNGLPERVPGEQFKVIAGLHIYPFGIFKLDNAIPGPFKQRSSLFLGISIPKALDNYYVGYSYDWVPGIKTIIGVHFYKETRFKVFNNQITDQASGLKAAGLFTSVNIEPSTFIKALGLF